MTWMTRLFWICFSLSVAIYLLMALWSLPVIMGDSGGLLPFDARILGYSQEQAVAFLSALGPDGLAQYQGPQRVLDLIFPALLAFTLTLAYLRLFPRKVALGLGVVAVLAAVFDYRENSLVAQMLDLGAARVDAEMVAYASRVTVVKWAFYGLALLGFVAGLVRAMPKKWHH